MSVKIGRKIKLKKDFKVIRETLERCGIVNERREQFFPSCYCVEEKDGTHSIVHFKELFIRDGRESTITEIDYLRRDTIIFLLIKWDLIELSENEAIKSVLQERIDVLPKARKNDYKIIHKYRFIRQVDI